MYPNSEEKTILDKVSERSADLVWWKPEQKERGEDVVNDPKKGERPWIIPKATGQFLYDQVISNSSQSVLELGTSIGYSSIWIAYALRTTGGHLNTIEHSYNKIPVARANFLEAGITEYITLHEGAIAEVLKQIPEDLMFDGVFMDADRGHYHKYFPIIEKHLLPGAWVIADNAGNMRERMKPFLELLSAHEWEYQVLDLDNGLLVARKKTP